MIILIRAGKLTNLKKCGHVVSEQATTTKRSQITLDQHLRFYNVVQLAWEDKNRLNFPKEEFSKVWDHFMLNLDETCVLASEGTANIVRASKTSKQENIIEDSRESITTMRTGSAGGSSGPCIFLGKGVNMDCPILNYSPKSGAPPGSVVIMTTNDYMTDEA